MKFFAKSLWNALSITTGCAALAGSCAADCPCRQGGAIHVASQPGLPPQPGYPPAPVPDPAFRGQPQVVPVPMPSGPNPQTPPPPMSQQPVAPPASPAAPPAGSVESVPPVNRFDVAPPPGTLGRTYLRRSRLIDDSQHPRWAAVDVHLPEDVDVSARGLKSKWTGEVWRLEVETPLLPGVPHIYAIKAERDTGDGEKSVDVRWVRLIMGRVVDLEF